jgi:hypothetical protein
VEMGRGEDKSRAECVYGIELYRMAFARLYEFIGVRANCLPRGCTR